MRFGLGFDALTDFVARAYETATTADASSPTSIIAPRPPEEQRAQDELQKKLVLIAQDARQRSDAPLEKFARAVEQAWTSRNQGLPVDDKTLKQLEQSRTELKSGDGFGQARTIPPELDRALSALRAAPSAPPPPGQPQPELDVEAELALAESQYAAENPGASLYDDSGVIDDRKVKEFVQKYYAEEFEAPPEVGQLTQQSEEEILAQLPESQKQKLMQLPAAERSFLLTADPSHHIVHAQMQPDEAKFFAGLKPDQRGQYLSMTADEKKFFRTLNPDERKLYLSLNPDNRAQLRQLNPAERKVRVAEAKAREGKDSGRPIEEVAPELADSVLSDLGLDPVRDVGMREKARALAFNYLKQTPHDRAAAETGLKKAMLQDPGVLDALLDDLEEALDHEPTAPEAKAISKKFVDEDEGAQKKPKKEPVRRAHVGEYTQHFARIRQTLPQLAQRMVQPGLSRKQMIEGMKNAVVVSAELAAAYPNRKGMRASSLFGKAPIVG